MRRSTDFVLAVAVIGILGMMIVPLPSALLDIMLTMNISLSLLTLFVTMYILKPIEFSVFPSLLLVLTLYRLALNVASARLVLLRGHEGPEAAGSVIHAFGSFVVGGNFVVGFVVFLILVVIQFVVITKGAGRIDEVAGLIITAINILGGLAIGILQQGLPIGQALETYTLLTIGDGLVTQLPALIVSTAS